MAVSTSPNKRSISPKKTQPSGSQKKPATAKKEGPPAGGDIRSFFGGPSPSGPSQPRKSGAGTNQKPIAIDDSEEEEDRVEIKPSAKIETKPKPLTSKHFPTPPTSAASTSKRPIVFDDSPDPSPPPKPRSKSAATSSKMPTTKAKRKVVQSNSDPDEDVKPVAKRQSVGGGRIAKKPNYADSSEDDMEMKPSKAKTVATKKAKKEPSPLVVNETEELDISDGDEDDRPKKGKAKSTAGPKKSTPVKKEPAKANIPKKLPVKQATPKKSAVQAEDEDGTAEKAAKPKPNWQAMAARSSGPRMPGSKDIPEGGPNCLAGLTFVFTGELDGVGREEAQELVTRYSGKHTGAPSGKTNYIVVGENAGEGKLKKIKELQALHKHPGDRLLTINEDEFLDLIRNRSGPQLDEKALKAKDKEEKKIQDQAKEMEKRESEEEKLRQRKEAALEGTGLAAKKTIPTMAQLWTTKYAPQNMKEICGNKAPVERLGVWLQDWSKNYDSGFKKPGKDGMGVYRAVLISGPPGIGKTTSAHLAAKNAGYNPIELNASDARSKKLVENSTNIDNASLDGFFQGSGLKSTTAVGDLRISSRTCLIMDEVDGMSAGDRGGVGALNALIKKTRIPMILVCNDRTLQKMKPLQSTTYNMSFRRPMPAEIRSRLLSILFKEKMKVSPNVLDELVKGANSDIRQVLNMLSTWKLGKSDMDFDEGKELVKVNEKNTILTPFTIIDRLTGPYAFSRTNKETLNEKADLYFHDFSFVPLFMQEHYLKTQPSLINNMEPREQNMKHLDLLSKAADSISDGDLTDRMIHGSEQHWSLLPLHAYSSTVRPASLIYGAIRSTGGGGGGWGPSFPQQVAQAWLGQNSKQGKLQRQLTDIQIRMRLRVSGGRAEIREQYMPILASKIILPLVQRGAEAVEETIEYMDEYYLGKDDWDAFVELGVDTMKEEVILKKIPTATKTAFTRQYNKADHPIAFHKGDMFASAKRKIADIGPTPDNEDVFEEDEAPPDDESEKAGNDDEEVNDVSKDKLIKAVKPKGAKAEAKKGKK